MSLLHIFAEPTNLSNVAADDRLRGNITLSGMFLSLYVSACCRSVVVSKCLNTSRAGKHNGLISRQGSNISLDSTVRLQMESGGRQLFNS